MTRLLERVATLVDPSSAVVAHVGAHEGQEIPHYTRLGFADVVFVEPSPRQAAVCRESATEAGFRLVEAACGAVNGSAVLHATRSTQLSSLLAPIERESRPIEVQVCRLDELVPDATVAVLDVQGAELAVLAGASMCPLEVIAVEVRTVPAYVDGPLRDDVVQSLVAEGWRIVDEIVHRSNKAVSDLVCTR